MSGRMRKFRVDRHNIYLHFFEGNLPHNLIVFYHVKCGAVGKKLSNSEASA